VASGRLDDRSGKASDAGPEVVMRAIHQMTVTGRAGAVLLLGGVLLVAVEDSAALVLNPRGHVNSFQVTPDSRRVVYRAVQETGGPLELFSVPAGGGPVTRLHDPLRPGGRVFEFQIAPDSSRVVYIATPDPDAVAEIYSVPVDGGPVTKLNPPLVSGGGIGFFAGTAPGGRVEITPDSRRVVYLARQETAGVAELYAVALDGGPVTKLSGSLVAGGDVRSFRITPDGGRVVYLADQDTDDLWELYSVPVTGGAVTPLAGPVGQGPFPSWSFEFLAFTSDGSRAVYLEDAGNAALASVPVAGGPVTRISHELGGHGIQSFQIAPGGDRVVYLAAGQLHGVAVDGGPVTALTGPSEEEARIASFQITPDGRRVVYVMGYYECASDPFAREFFSVALEGGPSASLTGPVRHSCGRIGVGTFRITADSRHVVFRAQETGIHLYSAPIEGGAVTRLSAPLAPGKRVWFFLPSSDSTRVVYATFDGLYELYSVAVEGGPAMLLGGPLRPRDTSLAPFLITPDSRRALFRGGASPDGAMQLHEVPLPLFSDVPPAHPFSTWIEALASAGIAAGCGTAPARYCPEAPLTRAQMAIFLFRGLRGPGATPPPATGAVFTDVPAEAFAADWIEELVALGVTAGCSTAPPRYCPEAAVTRAQAAVFLLRARHGAAYQPPAATGTVFEDVPAGHLFAAWIEQLAREGITAGCATGPARFCPEVPVTRGQMAVFLVRAFELSM
jgi:hypothetical protein